MKKIKVNCGKYILIDDEDYELVSKYTWSVYKPAGRYTYYAVTHIFVNGKRTTLKLHRLLLGLCRNDGKIIDHINRNGLDNRRSNLRITSHSVNNSNKRLWGKSGYKGVTAAKNGKWRAQVRYNGNMKHLGQFNTKQEASKAYQQFILRRS